MKWFSVAPVSGSLVINVGDALQIMSNGKYKSVERRVSTNGSHNRISVPIFVNPKASDIIGPFKEVLQSGEKPIYKHLLYSDYVKHFFRKAHDGKATIDFAKAQFSIRVGEREGHGSRPHGTLHPLQMGVTRREARRCEVGHRKVV
ncbi:hypothetical protein R6Q59_011825 [Mikania micrantha]